MQILKKSWFNVPIPENMNQFVGRFVKVRDDEPPYQERIVEIERIVGNMPDPKRFEIESKGKSYLISMLDFFAQMNGEKVSAEDIAFFEDMAFEVRPDPTYGGNRTHRRMMQSISRSLNKRKH